MCTSRISLVCSRRLLVSDISRLYSYVTHMYSHVSLPHCLHCKGKILITKQIK